jgi:hypothetical protein
MKFAAASPKPAAALANSVRGTGHRDLANGLARC